MSKNKNWNDLFKIAEKAFESTSVRAGSWLSEQESKTIKEIGTKALADCQQAIDEGRDLIWKSRYRPIR